MMSIKPLWVITLFCILLLLPIDASSHLYLGGGGNFIKPFGELEKVTDNSFGGNLYLESRAKCKLWWGIRFDYISFKKKDLLDVVHYESAFMASPTIRYNILGEKCYDYKLMPYLQGLVNISSITSTDAGKPLALGLSGGVGVCYGFQMFKNCWMVDLNLLYSAPNAIWRSKYRQNLQFLNVSLSLSKRL